MTKAPPAAPRALRRRIALVIPVVLLAVLAAGCGKDGGGGNAAPAGSQAAETSPALDTGTAEPGATTGPAEPIRLAIVADCEGPLVGTYEPVVAAIQAAFAQHAGGTPAGPHPTDGMTGIVAGGRAIEIVGYGCADGTAEGTAAEVTRLLEESRADVLIGPTSPEGGIATARLALDHPDTLFLDPGSAAQETTLVVGAPNVFRFGPDGAQTTAGLGDYAASTLGWKSAALLGEDTLAGYTTLAGFTAEFCGVGGVVTTRIWAPPGETEFAPYVTQLPVEVDGYVVALDGPDLAAFIETFQRLTGKVDPTRFLGTSAWLEPETLDLVGERLAGSVAATPTPVGKTGRAKTVRYGKLIREVYPQVDVGGPSALVAGAFNAATALVVTLEETGGATGEPLLRALSSIQLDTAYGPLSLDTNRQAIQDNYLVQIVPAAKREGYASRTLLRVPSVEQDFGGAFTAVSPPPDRANPACRAGEAPPWAGKAVQVRR